MQAIRSILILESYDREGRQLWAVTNIVELTSLAFHSVYPEAILFPEMNVISVVGSGAAPDQGKFSFEATYRIVQPISPAAAVRPSIRIVSRIGSDVRLRFQGEANRNYTLQHSGNLFDWQETGDALLPETGVLEFNAIAAQQFRFYRLLQSF